jgi:hypothetical protein
MSDDNDDPSLTDVLNAAVDAALAGLRTNLPGEVKSYDANNHVATVQVMIPDPFLDEVGERRPQTIAILPDVPVAHMGFGSIRIKIPVKPGAQCWLSFSSSCLTAYKASGGKLVDPKDDRRHHEADVIILPFSTVGLEDDATLIEFTEDGQILAGGNASLATKSDLSNLLQAITDAVIVANDGGASLKSTILAALNAINWPSGTTKLKGS